MEPARPAVVDEVEDRVARAARLQPVRVDNAYAPNVDTPDPTFRASRAINKFALNVK